MFPLLPKLMRAILIPNAMIIWRQVDAFGGGLGLESRVPLDEIGAFIKDTLKSSLNPSAMWGCREKTASMKQEADHHETPESSGTLILDFPATITMRNKCVLFISHLVYDMLPYHYSSANGLKEIQNKFTSLQLNLLQLSLTKFHLVIAEKKQLCTGT